MVMFRVATNCSGTGIRQLVAERAFRRAGCSTVMRPVYWPRLQGPDCYCCCFELARPSHVWTADAARPTSRLKSAEFWNRRNGLAMACEDYCRNRNSDWEQSGSIGPKAGLRRHCWSHSSVASLIAPEQWCVFCAPSLATFLTCCYQLDSNLVNMEARVEVG